MKEVERKLDIHNGYSQKFSESNERLAGIEKSIEVIKTDIKWIKEERK